MRKNNLAKKFVAYSMAFAVAFSTITVSPVFVKEAKAEDVASKAYEVRIASQGDATKGELVHTVLGSISTHNTGVIANSNILLGEITSNDLVNGTIIPFGTTTNRASKFIELSKLDAAKLKSFAVTKSETHAGLFDVNSVEGVEKSITVNGKDNKNVKLATDTPSTQHTWYKLDKKPGSFEVPQVNSAGLVVNETVSFDYYILNELDDETKNEDNEYEYVLPLVTADDTGIYLAVNKGTDTIAKVINLTVGTDLVAAANKSKIYASEGQAARLVVDATGSKTITYQWSKAGKVLEGQTTNTLSIDKVTTADFGKYVCTVSDELKNIPVEVQLSPADTSYADPAKATTINTIVEESLAGTKLRNDTVTLKTSIPGGDAYRYIWTFGSDKVDMSATDELAYNSEKNSVVITEKSSSTHNYSGAGVVKCYAVLKSLYNAQLSDTTQGIGKAYKELAVANDDVTKYEALKALRDAEVDFATSADPKNYEYVENFSFSTEKELEKDVVVAKIGDKVTFTAPTNAPELDGRGVKEYTWKVNNSQTGYSVETMTDTNTFTIDCVDVKDFGQITCEMAVCKDATKHTAQDLLDEEKFAACTTNKKTYTANLVYTSDLSVKAEDVTAKVGAKNVKLSAVASSSLPVTYQWYKDTNKITGETKADYIISEIQTGHIYVPEKNMTPEYNVFRCVAFDGIVKREAKVKITEIPTFDVYETEADAKAETGAFATNVEKELYATGNKDGKVLLAPVVVANEGINVTYKWEKAGITVGTDTTLTVDTPKTVGINDVYKVTITDGTKTIVAKYTVSQVDVAKIKNGTVTVDDYSETNTYTGKAINPVKRVVFNRSVTGGSTYTENLVLTEGTDYEVVLVENVNVGIGRFAIKLLGAYEEITGAKALLANYIPFYIDRANNEVKLADVTANVGGNVKPVATDLANAPMTIKFYADKALTKEVTEAAVKAKAGTYYAQASAIATANYNAAKSNVATIVVKGLGTTSKLSVTKRTSTTMTVSYAKVANAAGYRIYVKNVKTNYAWKAVANTTALTYKVTGLPAGYNTAVAVRAYDAKKVLAPKYASVTKRTAPGTTSKVTITTSKNAAKLTWNKVAGATHYRVYVKKAGKWTALTTTKSNTFTKTGLKRRTTYTFAVRAYNSTDKLWADKYVAKSAKTK